MSQDHYKSTEAMRKEYEERVKGPGKFENEPALTPYYYEAWLNGEGENHDSNGTMVNTFEISESDRGMFPELVHYSHVAIWEDDSGFVYARTLPYKNEMMTALEIGM